MATEVAQIITTLKRLLKLQGITYRDLAKRLALSEPSVKRLFSSGRLTVERLEQISHALGFTLAELSQEAVLGQMKLDMLTVKQEQELVSDPKMLIVAVCALNNWTPTEIVAYYRITESECLRCLLKLDKLRILDLLPGNRIRLNISRNFDWMPGGPIQQYFQSKRQADFLKGAFDQAEESRAFVFGMLTEQATAQLIVELHRLRQRIATLHEESLVAPLSKRSGFGLLLAMRRWEPSDFAQLRR